MNTTKINGAEVSTFDQNAMRLYVYVQRRLARENGTWGNIIRELAEEHNKTFKSLRLLYIRGHRLIYGDEPCE